MDAYSNYLVVDPKATQFGSDKETLVEKVKRDFESIFRKPPEQAFWCYGYEIACAGPIPER